MELHTCMQKWPERRCTLLLTMKLRYSGLVNIATTLLGSPVLSYPACTVFSATCSLYSPCTLRLSIFHTPLRHQTCEPCTALRGHSGMDRCGFPRPHPTLGKSRPVQIWKSCICTDLAAWAQPWATPATQIPEVGGIQLAWKASEANTCLSAPVLVNIWESTASLLGK